MLGPHTDDEDTRLVEAARSGDDSAFEALVECYERRVYAVAFRMLADREDARDAAQDAFLRAYRSLPGFHGDSKFSTWIYRIVANLCVDKLRRRDGRVISLDAPVQAEDDGGGAKTLGQGLIDPAGDVLSLAENTEFRRLVARAVESLPAAHRVMVVMRDYQDLSYPEIAEALKCPPGTVKSRLSRARAKLREVLLAMRELEGYIDVKQKSTG